MTGDAPPRIGNLPREEWTDEAREVFAYWGEPGAWENGSKTNMTMTLANHPPLANRLPTRRPSIPSHLVRVGDELLAHVERPGACVALEPVSP